MDEDWKVVFTVNEVYLAEAASLKLRDHGIESRILNKLDSVYPSIGHIEVLVIRDNAEKAGQLLKEIES